MPAELMALAVREFGITIDRAAKRPTSRSRPRAWAARC
jgi:hypothetical protein